MPRDGSAILLVLLLLAALHASASALSRPLFQVSDEVTYLASVQRHALAVGPDTLRPCVSPPDGAEPAWMPRGGKWLFQQVGSAGLLSACRLGAGSSAAVWLRLAFGFSLVVVTWAGWQVARLLYAGTWIPAVAALGLATQPVLAKYAAAVTPDSLANMFAALACVAGVHWCVRGPGAPALLCLVAATALAVSTKDTALGLVPLAGVLVVAPLVSKVRADGRVRLVAGMGLLLTIWLASKTQTMYHIEPGVAAAREAPRAFVTAVLVDLVQQMGPMVLSAWTSLGVFGGTTLRPPASVYALLVVLGLVVFSGLLRPSVKQDGAHRMAIAYLWVTVAICLIQPAVRQVLLRTVDLHQGRWLFPAAVPAAILIAAGLYRALGRQTENAWPLLVVASLTGLVLGLQAVLQWYVLDADWRLASHQLYVYSTGGLAIDGRRIQQIVHAAWPASRTLVMALIGGILVCGLSAAQWRPHQ